MARRKQNLNYLLPYYQVLSLTLAKRKKTKKKQKPELVQHSLLPPRVGSYTLKYVYLLRGTKWMFKIGISNDPERRIKEIAHNPKIVCTYRYYCAEAIEKWFHKFFEDSQRTRKGSGKTEWFRLGIVEFFIVRLGLVVLKILHDGLIFASLVGVVVAILWVINRVLLA